MTTLETEDIWAFMGGSVTEDDPRHEKNQPIMQVIADLDLHFRDIRQTGWLDNVHWSNRVKREKLYAERTGREYTGLESVGAHDKQRADPTDPLLVSWLAKLRKQHKGWVDRPDGPNALAKLDRAREEEAEEAQRMSLSKGSRQTGMQHMNPST